MEDFPELGVVFVTASSQSEAEAIANALVEAKLAACVNLFPIQSVYTWQNNVHHKQEWQLFIKTKVSRFSDLEQKIKELHSYEVPEIVAIPIVAGSPSYLTWINAQVTSE